MPVYLTIFNDNELHLSFYYSFIKQKQFKRVIWKHEDNQQSILRNMLDNSGMEAQ